MPSQAARALREVDFAPSREESVVSHPRARFDPWTELMGTRMRVHRAQKKGFLQAQGDPGRCNVCTYDGPLLDRAPYLQCPRCKSSNRHRLIVWWLTHESDVLTPGSRVLHFAPELSLGALFRRWPGIVYETADLEAKGVTHRFDLVTTTLGHRFDLIVANHILEHIEQDRAAMRNLACMLKPGGKAIITVPLGGEATLEDPSITSAADREKYYGAADHVRMYGLDIAERLREARLRVTTWSTPEAHPDASQWAMRGETLFLCEKA